MAISSRALSRLAVPRTGAVLLQQSQAAPRLLLQTSRRTVGARPLFGSTQGPVSRQFRRGISDDAAPVPPPPKKPRFRALRWAWRIGYLSTIAGIAYIGYGVYQDKHPEPQVEPDPSKKTLVILGRLYFCRAHCYSLPSTR
jgi:NADH:ubiquinone reductase (non-electrogenic)